MAARITDAEVKEIIDTDITPLTAFITAANLIVTANLADKELGVDLLKEIERWLAAHLIAIRDPRAANEKINNSSVTYQGKTDMGLNHTSYGQQVLILDYTGTMASVGAGLKRASLEVIAETDADEYDSEG